jgi:hypothetical protein
MYLQLAVQGLHARMSVFCVCVCVCVCVHLHTYVHVENLLRVSMSLPSASVRNARTLNDDKM